MTNPAECITERIAWLTEELREAEASGDHWLARQCLASLLDLHRRRIAP